MTQSILIALLTVIVVFLGHKEVRRMLSRRRVKRKAEYGRQAENEAGELLIDLGYRLIEQHPSVPYIWQLDGEEMSVNATPDWRVKKDGRTYLVEVKTGGQANPKSAAIRRQLLEYFLYGNADGVLFVHGESGSVHHVEFPAEFKIRTPAWVWPTLFGLFVLAAGFLWGWIRS